MPSIIETTFYLWLYRSAFERSDPNSHRRGPILVGGISKVIEVTMIKEPIKYCPYSDHPGLNPLIWNSDKHRWYCPTCDTLIALPLDLESYNGK